MNEACINSYVKTIPCLDYNPEVWLLTRVNTSNEEPSTCPVVPTIVIWPHVERLSHHHDVVIEVRLMRSNSCTLGLAHSWWICRNSRTVRLSFCSNPYQFHSCGNSCSLTRTLDGSLSTPRSSATLIKEACSAYCLQLSLPMLPKPPDASCKTVMRRI